MNIAILGCGTVAQGVIRLIRTNQGEIARQVEEGLNVRYVLARHPEKAVALGFTEKEICTDITPIISDPEISVVVELIGGTEAAYTYVKTALMAGKHVVTANKDLIALHLKELSDLAEAKGVRLLFEGSVGGGIPLIAPLKQTLAANRIDSIYGILNGTTNYILSRMTQEGMTYDDALSIAQNLGYAEADPCSDVEGSDAARKIAILASLAFHTEITYPEVSREGITKICASDIRFAKNEGLVPKLLAVCHREEKGIDISVRPFLVPVSHPLSAVNGPFNAVYLIGEPVGQVMLYGQGAGGDPTASSVVGDILEIQNHVASHVPADCSESLPVLAHSTRERIYYLHLMVEDKPKVLAGIALTLGEAGVSIASLVQEQEDNIQAELMLMTHKTTEEAWENALDALRKNPHVRDLHSLVVLK